MYNNKAIPLALVALTGSIASATEPIQLEPTAGNIRQAGHIYFNVATGEKIATLIDTVDLESSESVSGSMPIWVADTQAQCADFGYTTIHNFVLSDSAGTTPLMNNVWLLDWAEVSTDTVVDMVQVHWTTDIQDVDSNSDGIADGVEGFRGEWIYWDAANRNILVFECAAPPLIIFRLDSLPGKLENDSADLVYYTADIDLASDFGNSMTFEIGDTDSDPQGAAYHNPRVDRYDADSNSIPDFDANQNGLADWGWSVKFTQPGTFDIDNADGDGDPRTGVDGDPSSRGRVGLQIASPTPGHAEYNPEDEEWVWVSDGLTAWPMDDAFSIGTVNAWNQYSHLAGVFYLGGFDCTPGQPEGYTPAAHFQTVLYGPSTGCVRCPADMPSELIAGECPSGDGVLNFLDISYFLSYYAEGNPFVDIAGNPDGTPDGQLNFLDVSYFLTIFAAGCP